MAQENLKEQLWKLFKKLPTELQDAIFSEKTTDTIGDVCERNKVPGNKMTDVAEYIGKVLMGLLPPGEFEKALVKEIKLRPEVAKGVAFAINRFIFFPEKEALSKVYEIEIVPPSRPKEAVGLEEKEKPFPKDGERMPKIADTYRETIE